MAAYAALNSVMYILQQIQHHPRPPITLEKQHMDSLSDNISYLQDFLEKYSHGDIGDDKEALESQIANAAYAAKDVIESHIVDQIHAGDQERGRSNSLFCQDLQKVIEDMNLIKKEVMEIQEKVMGINVDLLPRSIIFISPNIIGSSTVPPPKMKNTNTMVGFDDVLIQIMDKLTGHPPNRQVLPIVGMGGIGKTTLARHAYDNPLIVHHFHIRIWITISQEYMLRDILVEALSCHQNVENKSSEDELGDQLYKSLCGIRYLIVLDDMWSIEAWENLMLFFPDNSNGSRIIITTRLSDVSNYFESCGFKMKFLDEDKSWDLLCKIVFSQDQCCPSKLEEIGKKIARNCKGLPLSIVVIGGLLANLGKTQQHWEYVEKNLNSMVNLEDDQYCLKILYLSYNHLPIHLKPCFLYLGVFPEDARIRVSMLKNLWVAEGFLKPIPAKSLEVVAEEYLKDLIDRNLILVHQLGSSGKVKYCKIHDLLRDLCLREAKKDKFLWVSTVHDLDNLKDIQSQRRIIIHEGASNMNCIGNRIFKVWPSVSLAWSLICTVGDDHGLSHSCRLVRIFSMVLRYEYTLFGKLIIKDLHKDIVKLVNSRYVYLKNLSGKAHAMFSPILWNLQMLIIDGYEITPREIFKMSQLRYLVVDRFSLPDPPNVPLIPYGDDDYFILRNLQKIKEIRNLKLSEKLIKRIPNIKSLYLFYDANGAEECCNKYCLNNLGLLNKLESLSIKLLFCLKRSLHVYFALPHSLKKLSLCYTNLHWEDMRMIASLPHLQVLKLEAYSFRGPEWNPVEGEFLCLKFLVIERCFDLVYWNANRTHFPCLEKLHLCNLRQLKEIPWDIGRISTLQLIELKYCSDSAVKSAKKLLAEQVELGNEDLQVLFK